MKAILGRSPRVKIHVEQETINNGISRDSGHCMIAEAIKTSIPTAQYVSVDLQTIRFSIPEKGERYTYLTPRKAQIALVEFDQGIKPKPFSIQLRTGQTTRAGTKGRSRGAGKSSLQTASCGAGNGTTIPQRVGGKPPPILSKVTKGIRRAFGLRGLEF